MYLILIKLYINNIIKIFEFIIEINKYKKGENMKILKTNEIAFIRNLTKAYTEGVYSDTPANRKLGRVGMSYADYAKKVAGGEDKGGDTGKLELTSTKYSEEGNNYIKEVTPYFDSLNSSPDIKKYLETTIISGLKKEDILSKCKYYLSSGLNPTSKGGFSENISNSVFTDGKGNFYKLRTTQSGGLSLGRMKEDDLASLKGTAKNSKKYLDKALKEGYADKIIKERIERNEKFRLKK